MNDETKDNEHNHTFNPHDSTLEPDETLCFSWGIQGADKASLFYNDDTMEYNMQKSDDVDFQNKLFKITINHFSCYALAYGR